MAGCLAKEYCELSKYEEMELQVGPDKSTIGPEQFLASAEFVESVWFSSPLNLLKLT